MQFFTLTFIQPARGMFLRMAPITTGDHKVYWAVLAHCSLHSTIITNMWLIPLEQRWLQVSSCKVSRCLFQF